MSNANNLPPPQVPFVDTSGRVSTVWWQFMLTLFNRTGGTQGSDASDLEALIAELTGDLHSVAVPVVQQERSTPPDVVTATITQGTPPESVTVLFPVGDTPDDSLGHGAQPGGEFHDVATQSVAGFMSAADKQKLDNGAFGALSASGNDALRYINTAGQSVPSSTTTVLNGWTKAYDRLGANFNAATGTFTAPVAGYYVVNAQILYGAATISAGSQYNAFLLVNGALYAGRIATGQGAVSGFMQAEVHDTVYLTAGQTIQLAAFQNTSASMSVATLSGYTFLSIARLP
jgi:hypothetical protein